MNHRRFPMNSAAALWKEVYHDIKVSCILVEHRKRIELLTWWLQITCATYCAIGAYWHIFPICQRGLPYRRKQGAADLPSAVKALMRKIPSTSLSVWSENTYLFQMAHWFVHRWEAQWELWLGTEVTLLVRGCQRPMYYYYTSPHW